MARLPADELAIRLLTIGGSDGDAPISCSLRLVYLRERPRFTALSYTWHSPLGLPAGHTALLDVTGELTQSILVDGNIVRVSDNLCHALRRLQSLKKATSYWIDLLCIDQDDTAERSRQVSIMADIYDSAEDVIIWLGPDEPMLDLAIELIDSLAKLPAQDRARITPYSMDNQEVVKPLPNSLNTKQYWHALGRFFCRRWFTRAWVMQEFLLAKESALLVFCGEYEISWRNLEIVSDYLALSAWSKVLHDPAWFSLGGLKPHHNGPTKLRAAKRALQSSDDNILLYSLIRSRRYDCDDPRDKVFSLYGVARRRASDEIYIPVPNYDLTPTEVYIRTAISILQGSGDLLLLAYAEGNNFRKISGLPSWVPDWSVRDVVGLGITGYKRFDATVQRPRYVELRSCNTVLAVEAKYLDTINAVGESKHSVHATKGIVQWLEIVNSLPETYCTGETRVEAFWRTLVTGAQHTEEYCQSFHNWLLQVISVEYHLNSGKITTTLSRLAQLRQTDNANLIPSEEEIACFLARMESHHLPRTEAPGAQECDPFEVTFHHATCLKLFRTTKGYLGLGTESMEELPFSTGHPEKPPANRYDVYIVSGSRVPLILSPVAGAASNTSTFPRFQLVGAAYVHGFMQGEALGPEHSAAFKIIEIE